jgi:hypothetical protein
MRKLYIVLVLIVFATAQGRAADRSMFQLDEAKIQTELEGLTQLEEYLATSGATLASMTEENHFLLTYVRPGSADLGLLMGLTEPPLGVSSFLWGFCLGLPGIAIVYFVADDKDETRKALWGCVAGSLLYGVLYFGWWALWSASTTYY